MFKIALFLFLVVSECLSEFTPAVFTKSGKIRGHYLTSFKGYKYEAYQGIPYAKPPIAERRFKSPELIEPWSSELLANKLPAVCLQHDREPYPLGTFVDGDEDCLYLDIYVPMTTRQINASLPVIFWIHGGAFQYGNGGYERETYLIDYDVIFVSVQYRLGVLGFLSTQDNVVSGNMGLKDQSMALKWVYDNIKYFGGDNEKIALVGLSAGGASVHYHYLSPMSAGLFHSGISASGTAFNCWAQTKKSRDKAITLAKMMECPTNDMEKMIECLRKVPARVLVEAQAKFMPWRLNPFTPFGPVVEKFAADPFIDSPPSEIINTGRANDVPWITGVVSEEGLYPVAELTDNATLKEINDYWEKIAPFLLNYNYTIPKEEHASLARKIRKYYFGENPINRQNLLTLTHLVGDRIFSVDAQNAAHAQAKVNRSPVWFYYYSYRAIDSASDRPSHSKEDFGVDHSDDVYLVLDTTEIDPTKSSKDMAMQTDLIQFWVSVAYNGKPNIGKQWTNLNPYEENLNYIHLSEPGNVPNFSQTWTPVNSKNDKLNYLHMIEPNNFKDVLNDNMRDWKFWIKTNQVKI